RDEPQAVLDVAGGALNAPAEDRPVPHDPPQLPDARQLVCSVQQNEPIARLSYEGPTTGEEAPPRAGTAPTSGVRSAEARRSDRPEHAVEPARRGACARHVERPGRRAGSRSWPAAGTAGSGRPCGRGAPGRSPAGAPAAEP